MVWFRVDDILPFHQRVIEAGNAAMGLWVRAGAWSSGQLTDGVIPKPIARQLGSSSEIRRLVAVGLWIEERDAYRFHAWAEDGSGAKRQPTRVEVETQRKAERDRKAAWRATRHTADVPPSVPLGHPPGLRPTSQQVSGHPVPSRPVPDDSPHMSPSSTETRQNRDNGLDNRSNRYGFDGQKIRRALGKLMSELPDDDTVMRVATTILSKAPELPADNTAYILGAMKKSPLEVQQLAYGGAA